MVSLFLDSTSGLSPQTSCQSSAYLQVRSTCWRILAHSAIPIAMPTTALHNTTSLRISVVSALALALDFGDQYEGGSRQRSTLRTRMQSRMSNGYDGDAVYREKLQIWRLLQLSQPPYPSHWLHLVLPFSCPDRHSNCMFILPSLSPLGAYVRQHNRSVG
jgi:hypothetical protein